MVWHLCFLAWCHIAVTHISMDKHMHSFTHAFLFLSVLSSAAQTINTVFNIVLTIVSQKN